MSRVLALLTLAATAWIAGGQVPTERGRSGSMTVDEKFIRGATSGGQYEVQASTMALQRATDPQVKKFAQQIIDDHNKLNSELAKVTQQRRKPAESQLNPVHAAMLAELGKESGADFDECYISQQILAHEGALMCFRKEAKKGTDAELKSFAERGLPKLREHLQMARRICEHGQDSHHETLKPAENKKP